MALFSQMSMGEPQYMAVLNSFWGAAGVCTTSLITRHQPELGNGSHKRACDTLSYSHVLILLLFCDFPFREGTTASCPPA